MTIGASRLQARRRLALARVVKCAQRPLPLSCWLNDRLTFVAAQIYIAACGRPPALAMLANYATISSFGRRAPEIKRVARTGASAGRDGRF